VITWQESPSTVSDGTWLKTGRYWLRRVNSPVAVLQAGDQFAYRAGNGLASLKDITENNPPYPAFAWQAGDLFLYLPAAMPPETPLSWNRLVPTPREWGEYRSANVWIEASHTRIEGLDFRFGIGNNICVWEGHDLSVVDCSFSGSHVGVNSTLSEQPVRNIHLERCLYHNYPQHLWLRDWLDWANIYTNYANSTLIKTTSGPASIDHCVAVHCGDALQLNQRSHGPQAVVATHNWLAFGTDDALEAEGPAVNIEFRHNVVLDFHESLGLSPVSQGPVNVTENLFLHPQVELNGAQIKLVPPLRGDQVTRNINISQNTFLGNWLCWYSRDVHCVGVDVKDNLFRVRRQNEPPVPSEVRLSENDLQLLPFFEGELEFAEDEIGQVLQHSPQRELLEIDAGPAWWDWSHPATRELAEKRAMLRALAQ
jgi:hypothetical protein